MIQIRGFYSLGAALRAPAERPWSPAMQCYEGWAWQPGAWPPPDDMLFKDQNCRICRLVPIPTQSSVSPWEHFCCMKHLLITTKTLFLRRSVHRNDGSSSSST